MCSPNTPAATFDSRLVRFELLEIEATLEEEKKQKAIQRSEFIHTRGNRKRLIQQPYNHMRQLEQQVLWSAA